MARFARFDPSTPDPSPVLGWYDTGAVAANLPPDSHLCPVSDAIWDARTSGSWAVQAGDVVPHNPAVSGPTSWSVPKLVIVQRLIGLGKLRDAFAMLRLDSPLNALSDRQLQLREEWNARLVLQSDDPLVHELLASIGCDPAEILALPS